MFHPSPSSKPVLNDRSSSPQAQLVRGTAGLTTSGSLTGLHQRGGQVTSPININNYINIYTQKQPLSFNPHFHRKPSQPNNRSLNIRQSPFSKPINSSQKNISLTSTGQDRSIGSLDRGKFTSLDRGKLPQPQSGFLQNNVYCQGGGGVEVQQFKERLYGSGQRIKKGHRTHEKFSFNMAMGAQKH